MFINCEQIVKVWDEAIGENAERKASCEDIKLMAFARKLGRKNVENQMLKRVVYAVTEVDSSDELFAIFYLRN